MNSKERIFLALTHQEPDRGDIIKSCGQKDKKSISFGKVLNKNLTK